MEEKALQFAKEYGYTSIDRLEDWNGYACFEPMQDELTFTGWPVTILVRGEEVRFATDEETKRIMGWEK